MHELEILLPGGWSDYRLLDTGDGERLEQFGAYRLVRPDPQIVWEKNQSHSEWQQAAAVFKRTFQDKGEWHIVGQIPPEWPMHWQELTFVAKLSPFKHTGIFPEQSAHWQWFRELLRGAQAVRTPTDPPLQILNLFAYTGAASVVAASTGAKVTHVDASRSAIGWAKKNQAASGLDERSIRWILDDVLTFVQREVKRGVRYDGIILDPPSYGHGPNGERWEFRKYLPMLLDACRQVLTPEPLFVLLNAYAVSTSAFTLGNALHDITKQLGGVVTQGELVIPEEKTERLLSTGIWARWQR